MLAVGGRRGAVSCGARRTVQLLYVNTVYLALVDNMEKIIYEYTGGLVILILLCNTWKELNTFYRCNIFSFFVIRQPSEKRPRKPIVCNSPLHRL